MVGRQGTRLTRPPIGGPVASIARRGEIAQLVEHTTENRGVPGSSPGLAIGIRFWRPAVTRDVVRRVRVPVSPWGSFWRPAVTRDVVRRVRVPVSPSGPIASWGARRGRAGRLLSAGPNRAASAHTRWPAGRRARSCRSRRRKCARTRAPTRGEGDCARWPRVRRVPASRGPTHPSPLRRRMLSSLCGLPQRSSLKPGRSCGRNHPKPESHQRRLAPRGGRRQVVALTAGPGGLCDRIESIRSRIEPVASRLSRSEPPVEPFRSSGRS